MKVSEAIKTKNIIVDVKTRIEWIYEDLKKLQGYEFEVQFLKNLHLKLLEEEQEINDQFNEVEINK